uniref:Shugoshin C-terminal domain-containing protein n=2 Tax=Parascaris univalens TaxID=6257 RepID=A0A915AWT4_PARUN
METTSGKISFKNLAPFVQSNRSLASMTQQLRIDMAVRDRRIQELEMENDLLRQRIADMERADDEVRIEMIARRRVEKKVKLIRTAALKSIASLERFVKVVDESVDGVNALLSSGLFDKAHSPIVKASQLETVLESPPYSSPKVSSVVGDPLQEGVEVSKKRSLEATTGEGNMKKSKKVGELQPEVIEHHDKVDKFLPRISPCGHPYVANRFKRKSPVTGELFGPKQRDSISLLDNAFPFSSTSALDRQEEKRGNSNEQKCDISNGRSDENMPSRRPLRVATLKVQSY